MTSMNSNEIEWIDEYSYKGYQSKIVHFKKLVEILIEFYSYTTQSSFIEFMVYDVSNKSFTKCVYYFK